jgi:hypothetical protein
MSESPNNQELNDTQLANIEREVRVLRQEVGRLHMTLVIALILVVFRDISGSSSEFWRTLIISMGAVLPLVGLFFILRWFFSDRGEALPSYAERMDLSKTLTGKSSN